MVRKSAQGTVPGSAPSPWAKMLSARNLDNLSGVCKL
jgi:hypothetical protein